MFVTAVRQYLCTELLKHGLSLVVPVFQISLNIFQMLIVHFKIHLKTEMGVFLNNIILRVLESAHSTFQHKSMVLRFLQRICTDPQTIVDVYLNYDCDLKHLNIFGRIVQCLCRIAQGTHVSENWISAAEDFELKQSALSCLVSLVQSLMEWSKALDNHDDEASRAAHPEVEERTERAGVADAHDGSNHFASLKQKKMGMEEAVFRFNQKPKRGLEYLRTNKLIGDEPEDVVSFFRNSSGIDKTTLGEYLGEGDPFNIKVLYAYVDSLNFKGLPFDDALRFFLQDFRLPGEAQKIDRMMEKFAERYISTNGKQVPSKTCGEVSFANADTGYVLAYSIIMLNTDAHNPMVKNKMTKEGFQKNNRGINDGADLPAEFLSEIYDRIYNDEIKITDNKGAAANAAAATTVLSPKQKQMLFHTENETILKRSQDALAEGKTGETSVFHRATPGDHVRELFEVAWAPLLATFSVILEQYGASVQFREMMLMCLEAFKHSIRVLSVFYMETERDAFIAALAKFTQLGELDSLREMGQMNIESIKVLIGVAQQNGNYLGSSWAQVLRCVSSLERLQMISCGGKTELDRQHSSAVEQLNSALLIDTIDSVAVDSIFTNSVNLGSDAIVEFAKHLSEVSKEEIKCAVPRTFSMQKIVEISYFNMNRVRIVWSRLWAILGDHLTSIALSSNASLSMFAIDSLKQLSIKFLEKEELANYSFQHEFMKPFDMVLANSPLAEMRELTLQCIRQIVQSRSARIKSGWKNIFSALSLVTRDKDKAIVKFAADILHMVVSDCFGQFNEMFVECVNCLVAFACNRHSAEIAVQSVDGIEKCADELALGQIVAPSNADKFGDDEEAVRLWFPVLTGLSRVIMDPRLDVRTRSLNALFGMLRTHGSLFSPKLWQLVFRGVLFPIFDDVKYACEYVENDWLHTTCFSAFHLLIEVFSQFFVELDELVFSDLLELISHAMKQDDDRVASIGVACYISFVNSVEKHPSAEQWQDIIAVLVDAISSSSLDQLKPVAEDQELDAPTDESSTLLKRRCAVMLQYLEAVGPLARSEACCQGNLSGAMRNLVQELTSVHATCTACKSDSTWRERLESSGWAARVADLAQHQATSWSVLVRLLVCMCASGKLSDMQAELDQITNLTTR
jgi:brefeldin A-inhibited guanine nucleotide-exchange protein